MEKLLTRKEVEHIIGLKRSTIYDWMRSGRFPRPMRLGPKAVRWRQSDITTWMEELRRSNGDESPHRKGPRRGPKSR